MSYPMQLMSIIYQTGAIHSCAVLHLSFRLYLSPLFIFSIIKVEQDEAIFFITFLMMYQPKVVTMFLAY